MAKVKVAGLRDGLHSAERGAAARGAQGATGDANEAAQVAASWAASADPSPGERGATEAAGKGDGRFANRPDFVPSDTLYPLQAQYDMVGDIETVWDEYTGAGVSVGVYDTGVQYTHPDLDANYDASKHVVYNSVTYDGGPAASSPNGHGTHVAGIIAADAGGENGVGFAHGALLTGVNIFDPSTALDVNAATPTGFFAAMGQLGTFDVMNNSWGNDSRFSSSNNKNVAASFGENMQLNYVAGVDDGRDDLGAIITNSASNRNMDVQGEGWKSGIETIVVAAARFDGFAAYYSNFGSNVLVTAPGGGGSLVNDPAGGGGMNSTDLVGADGYSPGDFAAISGTSMATPVISGVAALMLEANPDLGWRDVQEIIAYSATETGSGVGAGSLGANEDNFWYYNGAGDWNGGGLHFSEDYGYGMVDPFGAVRLAEVWTRITAAQTSANDVKIATPQQAVGVNYGATFDQSFNFVVADSLELEHVTLNLNLDRNQFWQMDIWLTSPEGTEVQLANTLRVAGDEGTYDADDWFAYSSGLVDRTWSYGAQAFRGENTAGTWTVRIVDAENRVWNAPNADANTNFAIDWLQLEFVGAAADNDDHYIYTDEYADVGVGPRATLNDTNGGVDTINAVAIAGDSVIDLGGGASNLDGSALTITANVIENAFAGDGADALKGNASANALSGYRGKDTLTGLNGADTLDGGAAADNLVGGGQDDLVLGGLGADVMSGGPGIDTLDYSILAGEAFIDLGTNLAQNTHSGGNDTLQGFENVITGGGDDRVLGAGAANSITTGDGVDTVKSGGGNDSIFGGDGADKLKGGGDADYILGGKGADQLRGGFGTDVFDYNAANHAGVGALARDVIQDFSTAEADKIDFANVFGGVLVYIGAAAFGGVGTEEVRVTVIAEGQLVQVDTDGDGDSDMDILAQNSGLVGGAADFVL